MGRVLLARLLPPPRSEPAPPLVKSCAWLLRPEAVYGFVIMLFTSFEKSNFCLPGAWLAWRKCFEVLVVTVVCPPVSVAMICVLFWKRKGEHVIIHWVKEHTYLDIWEAASVRARRNRRLHCAISMSSCFVNRAYKRTFRVRQRLIYFPWLFKAFESSTLCLHVQSMVDVIVNS